MSELVKSFSFNLAAGIVSSLVVLYLDKQGLTTPAYVVFGVYLAMVGLVFARTIRGTVSLGPSEKQDHQKIDQAVDNSEHQTEQDVFHNVLALIAKYHSQGIAATPTLIAADLKMDPGITLAHMSKYHYDQFITFANGGKQSDANTAFFLSPNAWAHIKVVRA